MRSAMQTAQVNHQLQHLYKHLPKVDEGRLPGFYRDPDKVDPATIAEPPGRTTYPPLFHVYLVLASRFLNRRYRKSKKLYSRIVNLLTQPGEKPTQSDLASRLGVSRTYLDTCLNRLAERATDEMGWVEKFFADGGSVPLPRR